MDRFDETGITIPHTWEDLVLLEGQLGSYTGATRLREDQEYYDLFSTVIPRDLILRLLREQMGGREKALLKNHFPYSRILQFLPMIQHYVAWSVKGPLTDDEIKDLVEDKFTGREWISFETVAANKSIPEIWHKHVFINNPELTTNNNK